MSAHRAFILAAGFGTRLRPLTTLRPKPLVPVCGLPLLDWQLASCRAHGIHSIVVNAHWLPEQIEAWAEHARLADPCLTLSVQVEAPDILGTGGGLKAVEDQLAERFVVLNGDVLHAVDLTALLAAVPDEGGALVLRPHAEDADRYGHVSADATGTVVQMRDFAATAPEGAVRTDTHFTGIHAMHHGLLDDAEAGFSCILRTAYTRRIDRRVIAGVRYDGPWLDIGDPEAYRLTNLAVLRGQVPLVLDPFTLADPRLSRSADHPQGPVWVGRGARIHPDAVVRDAVIGPGATIGPVTVERSVVWDGVTVDQHLVDAIAYADDGTWKG
jgi:NDP-sugar pyrophosphorylase family protein